MWHPIVVIAFLSALTACAWAADVRVLYDFEDPSELAGLRASSENVSLDLSQDNGVTRGRSCARVVFSEGEGWGTLVLGADRIGDWTGYAALAFDVFQERGDKWPVNVELWDGASRDYHTRFTSPTLVRPGRTTVVVPIDRARRNGKEGRDWNELEPEDRIDLQRLTQVKIFIDSPRSGGDLVWWVDNVRLLSESALAGPPIRVDLPHGAKAFALGRATADVPGFTPVGADVGYADDRGFGIDGGTAQAMGDGWPDVLAGRSLIAAAGGELRFAVALPDGAYRVWLSAGMAIDGAAPSATYRLAVGDQVLYDDRPDADALWGERYLYRFLPVAYSQRPHALWLDFIDRMYPSWQCAVTVRGGRLEIAATRFWLSALVIAPAADGDGFARMVDQIRTERMQAFEAGLTLDPQHPPQPRAGDGTLVAFIPDEATQVQPTTGASDAERARSAYALAAAPGERLTLRLAATAHADVGALRFAVGALKGPATIPADAARIFVTEHRVRGDGVHEAGLRPQDHVASEAGMTRCFWAWLSVPDDAPAGVYTGRATLTPERGPVCSFPIALTVHPFAVRAPSWSLGMYYTIPADERIHREQLRFKRAIGFTATSLPAGRITGIAGDRVQVEFDEAVYRRVKEEGFGADPGHLQMSAALGIARGIARSHLGFGARVDQRPGSELTDARLKPLYQDWLRQYAEFIRAQGMPVAVEIVDEPREVPNPWNRTLDQTNTYADWMREAGFTDGFVTPMGDSNGGRDYASLADHAGIVSVHAGAGSRRLMERTLELGKPLWFYNTGMDRLSWGFYAWRAGVTGRWEWHFQFDDGGAGAHGYPNGDEWYNPFTGRDGMTTRAPATYPGAMLFKSGFFAAAEGIRDAAYLATLEDAMRAAHGDAAKAEALTRAEAFLADLRRQIPLIIDVHGLGGEDSGALVGQGLQSSVETRCEAWRRRAAVLIGELKG